MVLSPETFERVQEKYPHYNRIQYLGDCADCTYFRLTKHEYGVDVRGLIVLLNENLCEVHARPIVQAVSDGQMVRQVQLPI